MKHYLLLKDLPGIKAGIVLTFDEYEGYDDLEGFVETSVDGERIILDAKALEDTTFYREVKVPTLEARLTVANEILKQTSERGKRIAEDFEHFVRYPLSERSAKIKDKFLQIHNQWNIGLIGISCGPPPHPFYML